MLIKFSTLFATSKSNVRANSIDTSLRFREQVQCSLLIGSQSLATQQHLDLRSRLERELRRPSFLYMGRLLPMLFCILTINIISVWTSIGDLLLVPSRAKNRLAAYIQNKYMCHQPIFPQYRNFIIYIILYLQALCHVIYFIIAYSYAYHNL